MRDAKKYGLNDFQLVAVLVNTMLGAGIITLPRAVGEAAGRDGWLSILLAGAGVWLVACLIWALCRRFPTRTLPEFSILILGRVPGMVVSLAYVFYALATAGVALRIFVELIMSSVMIWTPVPLFIVTILVGAVYISRLGAESLGRWAELVIYITVVVLLFNLVPVSEFDPLNLRPVGSEGLGAVARAAPEAAFAFLGFEVLIIFFPFMLNREKVFRLMTIALAAVTLLYAGNTALVFGVMGTEHVVLQVWPVINYLRVGSLPVIQRFDTLVLFWWTAQVMAVVAIQYFAATFTVATLTRHHYHDLWSVLLWPAIYLVAIYPNNLERVFSASDWVGQWGFIGIVAITLLLLIVAAIRKLDESREEKT